MTDTEGQIAKFVRLQNGDDLISEVVEMEDENGIVYALFNPLKVIYMPSDTTGYLSIAFTPWVFPRICEIQEFIIHAEDVLLMTNVSSSMNEYYWDNLEHYNKKVLKEEDKINKDIQQQESYDEIFEALEESGLLDNKKVYH
jgi:hypothetical protein